MIRQTGGTAVGATSTRSRSRLCAMASGWGTGRTVCVPSTSIRRTSRARICWLIRTVGVLAGLVDMGHLLSCGLFGFALEKTDEVLDRHGVDLFAASAARRDFAVGGLAVAD